MSLINLGSISATIPEDKIPNFYVASVVHSKSGFVRPKLISRISQLESFYDSDFRYYDMYKGLIDKGIPVLLIPIITSESNINRSSLRLSDNNEFLVSHPAINYYYEYLTYNESDDWIINSDAYTHGLVLDFSSIDITTLNDDNYIMLHGSSFDELNKTRESDIPSSSDYVEQSEFMIWFPEKYNISSKPPLDRTIVKSTLKIPRFNGDGSVQLITTNEELTEKVKDKLNRLTNCTARNINDLVWHEYTSGDSLPDGILRTYIDNVEVNFSKADYESGVTGMSYSKYLKESSDEYLNGMMSYLYSTDYGVATRSEIVDEITRIFEEFVFLPTYDTFTKEEIKSRFESGWNQSSLNLNTRTKLLVEYVDTPGKVVELFNLDGFRLINYDCKTQDRICSYTENSKLIEFYSKVKGKLPSDITIEITKDSDTYNYYQVIITAGSYKEYYQINLDYDESDNSGYSNTEYKSIETLKNSKLVDVYIYDYNIYDSTYENVIGRIQSENSDIIEEFNDIKESGEIPAPIVTFANDNGLDPNDISTLWEFHKNKITKLPEGKFILSRSVDEITTSDDEMLSYGLIHNYRYYPDLILVDNLDDYSRDEKIEIIKYLSKLSKLTYSQVLIEVNEDDIFGVWDYDENRDPNWRKDILELFTEASMNDKSESRLLYFYGDLTIDEKSYPSYYPYITNILDSDYIRRVSDKILYRKFNTDKVPTDSMNLETLDKFGINYLLYNNLYYNYNRIKEVNRDPDFILRFNTSKITRIFMNSENKLINCEHSEFDDLINSLIDTAINLLPLVTYLNYEVISDDSNKRVIALSVKLESITNKLFILNINLNL